MQNVGGIDRVLRAIIGLAAIGVGIYFASWWGALGFIPLFTAVTGWCPLYALLGLSTKNTNQTQDNG